MTQCERVLDHLQRHGELDPMTSWSRLGVYRLGARIHDLKKLGHNIEARRKEVSNRFGEVCRVACYQLKKEENT